MKKDKDLQTEIEKTLNALDGLERVEAKPFFYTRLEGRLEKKAEVKRPAFAWQWAALGLMLMLNVAVIFQAWPEKQTDNTLDYARAFSQEYGFENTDYWGNSESTN